MNETMNGIKDGVEIDLQKLLLAYLRKWWLIVACGLLGGLIMLYYTAFHVTPLYRTSVTVYVNNTRSGEVVEYVSGSNLTASKLLVNTYVNIIGSDTVLEKVVEDGNLPYSVDQIRGMMSTSQVDDTEIFKVYITHPDPQVAAQVANVIADVAPSEIENIVEGSSTKIIDYAKVPTGRYSPSYTKNTMLGGIVGGVLAVLYVTLHYLLDVRIKDTEDVEMIFDIPVLGQIPVFNAGEVKSGYGYEKKNGYGYSTVADTKGR